MTTSKRENHAEWGEDELKQTEGNEKIKNFEKTQR